MKYNLVVSGLQFEGMRVREVREEGRVVTIFGEDKTQALKRTFSNGTSAFNDSQEDTSMQASVPLLSTHFNPQHVGYVGKRLKNSCFACAALSDTDSFAQPCRCKKPKMHRLRGAGSYFLRFDTVGCPVAVFDAFEGLQRQELARRRPDTATIYDITASDVQAALASLGCPADERLERCFMGRIPLMPRYYRARQATCYGKLAATALAADEATRSAGTPWEMRCNRDKTIAGILSSLICGQSKQDPFGNEKEAAREDEGGADLNDFVPKSALRLVRKIGRLGERFVNSSRGVGGPSANRIIKGYAGPVGAVGTANAMAVVHPRALLPYASDQEDINAEEADKRGFLLDCVGRGALSYVGAAYLTVGGEEVALTEGSLGWTSHERADGTVDRAGVETWLNKVWPLSSRQAGVAAFVGRHTCDGDWMFFWRSPVNTPGSLVCARVRVISGAVVNAPDIHLPVMDGDNDGDTFVVCMPLDEKARGRLMDAHTVDKLYAYCTGKPAIKLTLDGSLGLKSLRSRRQLSRSEFVRVCSSLPCFSPPLLSVLRSHRGTYGTKELLCIGVAATTSNAARLKHISGPCPQRHNLRADDGSWVCRDGVILTDKPDVVVTAAFASLPSKEAVDILQNLQTLGKRVLMYHPMGVGMEDCIPLPLLASGRDKLTTALNGVDWLEGREGTAPMKRREGLNAAKSYLEDVILRAAFASPSLSFSDVRDAIERAHPSPEEKSRAANILAEIEREGGRERGVALVAKLLERLAVEISARDALSVKALSRAVVSLPYRQHQGDYLVKDLENETKIAKEGLAMLLIGTPAQVGEEARCLPSCEGAEVEPFVLSTMGCDMPIKAWAFDRLKANFLSAHSSKAYISKTGSQRNSTQSVGRHIGMAPLTEGDIISDLLGFSNPRCSGGPGPHTHCPACGSDAHEICEVEPRQDGGDPPRPDRFVIVDAWNTDASLLLSNENQQPVDLSCAPNRKRKHRPWLPGTGGRLSSFCPWEAEALVLPPLQPSQCAPTEQLADSALVSPVSSGSILIGSSSSGQKPPATGLRTLHDGSGGRRRATAMNVVRRKGCCLRPSRDESTDPGTVGDAPDRSACPGEGIRVKKPWVLARAASISGISGTRPPPAPLPAGLFSTSCAFGSSAGISVGTELGDAAKRKVLAFTGACEAFRCCSTLVYSWTLDQAAGVQGIPELPWVSVCLPGPVACGQCGSRYTGATACGLCGHRDDFGVRDFRREAGDAMRTRKGRVVKACDRCYHTKEGLCVRAVEERSAPLGYDGPDFSSVLICDRCGDRSADARDYGSGRRASQTEAADVTRPQLQAQERGRTEEHDQGAVAAVRAARGVEAETAHLVLSRADLSALSKRALAVQQPPAPVDGGASLDLEAPLSPDDDNGSLNKTRSLLRAMSAVLGSHCGLAGAPDGPFLGIHVEGCTRETLSRLVRTHVGPQTTAVAEREDGERVQKVTQMSCKEGTGRRLATEAISRMKKHTRPGDEAVTPTAR
jgi:hypothetical protein